MTDPLLQHFTDQVMPQYTIATGRGLDIACGSGQNLIYLASNGWDMSGIDRSTDALEQAQQLAQVSNVKVATHEMDMETGANPFGHFPEHSVDLITVSRYLHRPLFPYIKALIKPGGILIYQTFMVGCEHSDIGHPRNPNFLLKPGELASSFASAERLLDEEIIMDDGRPFARFIARL